MAEQAATEGAKAGPIRRLSDALAFAAQAHVNQRRKGAAQQPYVNHLIEVMDFVVRTEGEADVDLLIAALLHDVVEDTPWGRGDLEARFGARVAAVVCELSDDMGADKEQRRRDRLAAIAAKSRDARIVKIADVTSNVKAIGESPPAGWVPSRRLAYLEDCRRLIDRVRGVSPGLEALFDETAAAAECAIRAEADNAGAGENLSAAQRLQRAIGQQVHLLYLPNTRNRPLDAATTTRFLRLITRQFPSATVQPGEALYDGLQRPILIARVRSDSLSAIVALAQAACLEFDEAFVGLEVDGRYIRVYADDTG